MQNGIFTVNSILMKSISCEHYIPFITTLKVSFSALMILISSACNTDKSDYVNRDDEALKDFTYIGVNSCIECHQVEYEKWRGSHHDLAMQVANDSTVLGDFNNVRTIIDGVSYFFLSGKR